jgi:hypothetical protein
MTDSLRCVIATRDVSAKSQTLERRRGSKDADGSNVVSGVWRWCVCSQMLCRLTTSLSLPHLPHSSTHHCHHSTLPQPLPRKPPSSRDAHTPLPRLSQSPHHNTPHHTPHASHHTPYATIYHLASAAITSASPPLTPCRSTARPSPRSGSTSASCGSSSPSAR